MLLFFLVAISSFVLQLFLPWWSMMIAAFVISYFLGKKPSHVFFAGFFGCAIIWLLMEVFIHFSRGDLMTVRIAELLSLPGSLLLYAGTFLISGIAGGIAALAGFFLKQLFTTTKATMHEWQ